MLAPPLGLQKETIQKQAKSIHPAKHNKGFSKVLKLAGWKAPSDSIKRACSSHN